MVENKLKQFAPSLISGLVLVLTIGAVSTVNLSQSRSLLAQQDEKVELQNRIDQWSVENNTQITKVKAQANGIDVNRVENDDKVAKELMETVIH